MGRGVRGRSGGGTGFRPLSVEEANSCGRSPGSGDLPPRAVIVIPFVKAHGAQNDFLLTWEEQVPQGITDMAAAARAICDRNTGAGADGWIVISRSQPA